MERILGVLHTLRLAILCRRLPQDFGPGRRGKIRRTAFALGYRPNRQAQLRFCPSFMYGDFFVIFPYAP